MLLSTLSFLHSSVEVLSFGIQALLYVLICIFLVGFCLAVLASVAEWLWDKKFRLDLRARREWALNEYETKRQGEWNGK